METVADLFEKFGGPTALARVLEVGPSTASEMKRRGSIPGEYWYRLAAAAAERNLSGIDLERIARLHAEAKGKMPAPEQQGT